MTIIYGFVYYFLQLFVGLTFGLVVFLFRPLRKILHTVQTKFQGLLNNNLFHYFIYFSFAIIFLILADSIRTFWSLNIDIRAGS